MTSQPGPRLFAPPVLLALVAICAGIEAALLLADHGVLANTRLRSRAYEYAGFWPGLLQGWQPNYTAQPYVMFLSYAFLHGGAVHLVVNMITLISLGQAVCARVGGFGFVAVYAAAVLGGALIFGLLTQSTQPMVGASGGLFGLAGAVLAWNYIDRFNASRRLWPVARVVLFLIALNLALWWAMDGLLAWQTHLGGFIGGWVAALLTNPRPQQLPE